MTQASIRASDPAPPPPKRNAAASRSRALSPTTAVSANVESSSAARNAIGSWRSVRGEGGPTRNLASMAASRDLWACHNAAVSGPPAVEESVSS